MNLKPINQRELHGLDYFILDLINLSDKEKLPQQILLSGRKGMGKSTLAFHLINYVLSKNEDNPYDKKNFQINNDNKSFVLINKDVNPNVHIIDVLKDKKNIELNQIRQLISYLNKSTFDYRPRFVLIDNIEYLNKNSTNALLKILEEPNKNVYFILINNNKKIESTIKSRCLNFKINLPFTDIVNITNKLLKIDLFQDLSPDMISHYSTPGEYYYLFEFCKKNNFDLSDTKLENFLNILIKDFSYKKDPNVKNLIFNFIELIFLKKIKDSNIKNYTYELYQKFIKRINMCKNLNLDEESLFLEFQSKVLNG